MNLSICENTTIGIYIPVVLSEKLQNLYNELKDLGYDLFDINSPFYQIYVLHINHQKVQMFYYLIELILIIIMKRQVVNLIVNQLII